MPSRPVRCNATALASKVRVSTIARYSRTSSSRPATGVGNGCSARPSAARYRVKPMKKLATGELAGSEVLSSRLSSRLP
ncbi:unannotated protein [freshwater metagenome]|uniref:Unannotated protein n=1 Tax=freshwater metagenome TaxID=449393 RepID=A0A6J7FU45_9ZZZZ